MERLRRGHGRTHLSESVNYVMNIMVFWIRHSFNISKFYMAVSRTKSVPSFCRVSRAKSGCGSGRKSAPRGTKSSIFAKGYFQPFSLLKFFLNPAGESSVLPIQHPTYWWDQAEVWEEFGIGGWWVVSCTSIQISKFTVQAQGYAIRYVMVHSSDKSPPPTSLSSFSLVNKVTVVADNPEMRNTN